MSRLEHYYLKAIDLRGDERSALLDEAAAEDETLARDLATLLSMDATGTLLEPLVRLVDAASEDDEPMLAAGDRVARWTVVEFIDSGASSEVYEVTSDRPPRSAALKLLHSRAPRGRVRRRFEREAEVLGMLDHPGIASIYRFDVAEGGPAHGLAYIVMSLVRGRTLGDWMKEQYPSVERLVEVVAEAADAVHFANLRGVVHRDLKPSNIMIEEEGRVRVIDFGVARIEEDNDERSITMTGHTIGTPAYMAPEQRRDSGIAVDLRADVYALGAVLGEALADQTPTAHDQQLAEVLAGALEPDPTQRYASCEAFALDLRRAIAGLPIIRKRPSAIKRGRLFIRRNPLLSALGIVALVAVLAGGGVSLLQRADAIAARGIAEDRFDILREFSRWVIFDLDDQLAAMPGTTAMRADIVGQATAALVAMDPAPDDDALAVELAEAHMRLYRVTGSQDNANIWDMEISIPNISRAVELLEPRLDRLDESAQFLYADAANELAINSKLSTTEAYPIQQRLLESAYATTHPSRGEPGTKADLLATYSLTWLGRTAFNTGRNEIGLAYARRALAELEARSDDPLTNTDTAGAFGLAQFWLGYALYEHDEPGCIPMFDQSCARFTALVAAGHGRWWFNLRGAEANAARAHLRYGDLHEGVERAREAMSSIDDDLANDPDNAAALRLAEGTRGWTAETVLSVLKGERHDGAVFIEDRAAALAFARATIDEAIALHRQRKASGWLRLGEDGYEASFERTRAALAALDPSQAER